MYRESEVLVSILLTLIDREITALPVHDCLVVAETAAEETERVMLETFAALTGHPASIERE